MMTEADIGVMYKPRSTKDGSETPESRRRQGRILLYRGQRKHGPADTLILELCLPGL